MPESPTAWQVRRPFQRELSGPSRSDSGDHRRNRLRQIHSGESDPPFYDATQGQVLVDGVDVRELNLEELRRRIAVVPQKAVLFRGPSVPISSGAGRTPRRRSFRRPLTVAQAMEIVQGRTRGWMRRSSRGREISPAASASA